MKHIIALGALLAGFSFSNTLFAATLYTSASGSGTECSEAAPCSLWQALDTASSNSADNTINMAAGTYTDTETLSYTGTEHTLTLTGAGKDTTFVTVTGDDALYFYFSGSVTVSGITLQNNADYPMVFQENPAAGTEYNVTVTDCAFTGNSQSALKITNSDMPGTFLIENNTFTNNETPDDGAGLYILAITADTTITVQDNTFSGNSATTGGAVSISSPSGVSFTGNTLTENTATDTAGGIKIDNVAGDIDFSNNVIQDNTAPHRGGFLLSPLHRIMSMLMAIWFRETAQLMIMPVGPCLFLL